MTAINSREDLFTSTTQEKLNATKYKASGEGMSVSHDDFLMLLVHQMSNQDPLNPMQDTDMMAQYAQLQQLDNQKTMTDAMVAMRREYAVQGASEMIGKLVTAKDGSGAAVSGLAIRVIYNKDNNNVQIEFSDGTKVNYTDVVQVEVVADGPDISKASNMINKYVTGIDSNAKVYNGIVRNVTTNGDMIYLETYDGSLLPLDGVAQVRDLTPEESKKLNAALALVNKYVEAPNDEDSSKPLNGVVKQIYSKDNQYWAETWGGNYIYINSITESRELTTAEMKEMEQAKKYVGKLIKSNDNKMTGIAEGFFYKEGHFYMYTMRGEVTQVNNVYSSRDYTASELAQYSMANKFDELTSLNLGNYVDEQLGQYYSGINLDQEEIAGIITSVYVRNGLIMFGTDENKEILSPFSIYLLGYSVDDDGSGGTDTGGGGGGGNEDNGGIVDNGSGGEGEG